MGDRSCSPGAPRAASASAPEAPARIAERRFPRARRLVRRRDFAKVFAASSRSHDRLFVVLCAPNGLGYPRLGLAIARKRIPLAHQRNRIKRQARESFRLQQEGLGGFDFVVMAQGGLAASDSRSRRKSLEWHWTQLATRCNRSSPALSEATSGT